MKPRWLTVLATMLLLASLVAGLATMPYAAYHFHRVTPYGVLANLAAMPVVSALVMPAGLLGLAAMPFGFDRLFWALMGVGIDWMIFVTQWVAALPGASSSGFGVAFCASSRWITESSPFCATSAPMSLR